MLDVKTATLELDDEPMRFAPIGPDVYGRTQPETLLTTIEEDAEPLKDLVDQFILRKINWRTINHFGLMHSFLFTEHCQL